MAVELDFEVKVLPRGPVHLVVERPEIFTIEVNGRRVEANDAGWFVDRSFRKEPVTGAIQAGRNTIRLSTSYHEEYEIEDCYLVGDFGVDSKTRAIVGRPDKLSTGSWVEQRLPFYSGAVIYKQRVNIDPKPGKRVFLDISKCDCTLLEVLVNGQSAGVAMWPPFEVDITELVTKGSAEIGIKVVSSRKNLMGPLHHTTKKLAWTGAAQFRTEGPQWTDDYNFVPYGIRGPVRVEYRR